ncbi:MAG: hypothetical protein M1821_005390 [Bathelium mastoideum]|nr:MAG: hypothetical protein M1821_005390 [Bathelium mastoideum]
MGFWRDNLSFYARDFAYANSHPVLVRMASENIAEASAKTFAEYVPFHRQPVARPPLLDLRFALLSGPLVDVYVGKQKRHWALHRNLLCHASGYLADELLTGKSTPALDAAAKKRTLNGNVNGLATDEETLELNSFDPAGFELFVKWLYQGRIDDVSTLSSDQQKYEHAVACHKLYLLCDRFEMPYLKNIAIDQYRKGLAETSLVPDADEINQIYRESPPDSPFRKLMVKIAARQLMDPEDDKDAAAYRACFEDSPDFAIQLFNTIKAGSGGTLFDDPTKETDCEYHDHEGGVSCHLKGKAKIQVHKAQVSSYGSSQHDEALGRFHRLYRSKVKKADSLFVPVISPQKSARLPLYMNESAEIRSSQPPPRKSEVIGSGLPDTAKESQGLESLESSLTNLQSPKDVIGMDSQRSNSTSDVKGVSLPHDTSTHHPRRSQKNDSKKNSAEGAAYASKRSPPKLRRKAPTPQPNGSWNTPHMFTLQKGLST